MGLLDLIFPKTCVGCGRWGVYLCETCRQKIQYLDQHYCPECGKAAIGGATHPYCVKKLGLDGLISLTYFSFPVNKLIHALKYRFVTDLTAELSNKLVFSTSLAIEKEAYLLPVPLHLKKQNYRGFNQSEILGQICAQKFGVEFSNDYLKRDQNTKAQVGLKRNERSLNVKGVFSLQKDVTGKSFIVFDDVWTTGATLKNITHILKKNGAEKVWGLTLARSR